MRLSFILPTYNCAEFLDEGVNSVISQISDEDELVLVDDGSTDNTKELLKKYEKIDNINVIYNEHKGPSGARNKGIDCAKGEYISFIDCDDLLKPGFIKNSEHLLEKNADLYIFGMERVPLDGNSEYWKVRDRYYESASDFADTYIVYRRLLVYSNCNKFYKRSIIEKYNMRFDEKTDFGEDRLFNFKFIKKCKDIVTSKNIMYIYVQRNLTSLSTKYVPNFFEQIQKLHKAKMECFLGLSKNVTMEDKYSFASNDITREIENTIDRFESNPQEIDENIEAINSLVLDSSYDIDNPIDIIIVLGSHNCEYRVREAFKIAKKNPDAFIIVSGGNPHKDGKREAVFMYDYLVEKGIEKSRIYIEEEAKFTLDNLDYSQEIIDAIEEEHKERNIQNVGIVTGAFHMLRVKALIDKELKKKPKEIKDYKLSYFSCYGENTNRDNWYKNSIGRSVVLHEFFKSLVIRCYLGE